MSVLIILIKPTARRIETGLARNSQICVNLKFLKNKIPSMVYKGFSKRAISKNSYSLGPFGVQCFTIHRRDNISQIIKLPVSEASRQSSFPPVGSCPHITPYTVGREYLR